MLYTGDGLRLAVCACYSLELALNVGLDASFDNIIIIDKAALLEP
jgi:hypothetical protein